MPSYSGRRAAREAGFIEDEPAFVPNQVPTPIGGATTMAQATALLTNFSRAQGGQGYADMPDDYMPEGDDEYSEMDGTVDRYQGMEYSDLVRMVKAQQRRILWYTEQESKRSRAAQELDGVISLVDKENRQTVTVVTAEHLAKRDSAFVLYQEQARDEEREYLDARLDEQDRKIDSARDELVALVPLINSLITNMAAKNAPAPKAAPRPRARKGVANAAPPS